MTNFRRFLAAFEIMLIFPAALFMTALLLRSIQPVQFQPARTAQQVVDWYAARPHVGLWLLLIALPLLVAATGLAWLTRTWQRDQAFRDSAATLLTIVRSQASALTVAATTSVAAMILAIVAFHMLTN